MKKKILFAAAAVALAAGIGGFAACMALSSPEYALGKIAADVKKSGLEGLELHLTGSAGELWDFAGAAGSMPLAEILFSALEEHYGDEMQAVFSEMEWSLGEVLKSRDQANITVQFSLPDRFSGSFPLTMVRVDGEWLISEAGLPDLENFHW